MGGQVSRHDNGMFGSVPVSTIPSASSHFKHTNDCSVPFSAAHCANHCASVHHKHARDCSVPISNSQRPQHHHKPTHHPSPASTLPTKHAWTPACQPPLFFHPATKGSQIIMDESHKVVSRRGSFCNAIVFSNRCVAVNEVVRLKITGIHHVWQGALRIGFTLKDPSWMNPQSLPRYSCPDLVSKSGYWVKPLPEELLSNGTVISFWVTKKGRVLYRINESTPRRLFRKVSSYLPLWVLVDVYGKTRGVQLLDSETLPPDMSKVSSVRSVMFQKKSRSYQHPALTWEMFEDGPDEDEHEEQQCADHMPQNSQNLRLCSELPDGELRVHSVYGEHISLTDPHTAVMVKHQGPSKTLVFTSRPLERGESVFVMLQIGGPTKLSYGVTSCDPATLRPRDLPANLARLLDRMEFWAFDDISAELLDEDILGFELNAAGEIVVSRNGINLGVQLCVDNSRPLWFFFAPYKNLTQLKIFGLSSQSNVQGPLRSSSSIPSIPRSPLSTTSMPTEADISFSTPLMSRRTTAAGQALVQMLLSSQTLERNNHKSSSSLTETEQNATPSAPTLPTSTHVPDECAICCDDVVNTVLYDCGHMCLCYACALTLKQNQALCPICRKPIRDIIKPYRSS